MNSIRQPPGTVNLGKQEKSAISKDPQVTREPDREEEDQCMTPDAASPESGPGSPDMTAEIKAASGTGLPLKPGPSLKSALQDILASLEDLQAVVKKADLQGEKDGGAAETTPGSADRGYQDLFDLAPDAYLVTDAQATIVASNQAAAATLKVDRSSLQGMSLSQFATPGSADRGYQDLFDLAPDAYLVTDAQATIVASNQAAAATLKVDRSSLQGMSLSHFVTEADRPAFHASLILVREGGEKWNWEFRLDVGEDEPLPVSVNVRAQIDHRDQLVRVLWLLRDVRESKSEENRLKSLLSGIKSSFHGIVDAVAAAVEIKDPQTAGHQRRVAQLAVAIAREMDFSLNRLEGIRVAGLLHDIGKIAVPIEILNKPGELNDLEREFIKCHCQIGFDLLEKIDFPWPVLQAILQHHERLNGSGYPAGLTDNDIILEAKILGVADVVEAMMCSRSYGPAQRIDQALEEIQQKAGLLYDPEVVNVCLKLFGEKGFSFN